MARGRQRQMKHLFYKSKVTKPACSSFAAFVSGFGLSQSILKETIQGKMWTWLFMWQSPKSWSLRVLYLGLCLALQTGQSLHPRDAQGVIAYSWCKERTYNYVFPKYTMLGNYTQWTQKYNLTRVLVFRAKILVNLLCDYTVLTTCTFFQYLILTMSLNGQQLLWKQRLLGKLLCKIEHYLKSLTFFTTAFFVRKNIQIL